MTHMTQLLQERFATSCTGTPLWSPRLALSPDGACRDARPYKARNAAFIAIVCLLLLVNTAVAQTTAFTYQGKLTDSGNPANGNYDMQFKLFDTVTVGTGTQQGSTITIPTVQVAGSNFTVQLDFGANVFDGTARYLEIAVRPAGSPNPYTVLAPRQAITSSPYAIQTVNTQQLGGLPASRYVASDVNGNVGIGTPSPTTRLEVVHPASQLRFGPTTADDGGYLVSTNPSQAILAGGAKWNGFNWTARDTAASITAHTGGEILFNTNDNLTIGNFFIPAERMRIDVNGNVGIGTTSPQSPLAVQTGNLSYGFTHTNGSVTVGSYIDAIGGWLGTRSPHPLHFFTNDGSALMTVATNGAVGVGTSNPTQARLQVNGNILNGVYASSNFHAVWGESFGANAAGLRGSGSGNGGFGVYGLATGDGNSVGVYGESTSSVGYGVFAKAPARGVWGKTTATGSGIYGDNGGSDSVGYAGFFNGRVHVTGLLSKGAGAFKIDHPLDPENKYLLHSFVESPDMMNIYNGNATTDEEGTATVTMPDWFEALNQDFRYQLTVIGQFAQAIIASKMQKNRFTIKTDRPHVEVSWQVTGIRHDAYANANRIPVEQEKAKGEAGYYLHPQAFGQPAEKGIERARQMKEPREPAQPKPQQQPQ